MNGQKAHERGLKITDHQFSSVQLLSHVRLFATPWIAARQASLSITNSWSSLRLTPIEAVMPSSHLILCRPLLLLPPTPPSIRVFSNESGKCKSKPKWHTTSPLLNGYHQKDNRWTLVRMWRKGSPQALLLGMQTSAATARKTVRKRLKN